MTKFISLCCLAVLLQAPLLSCSSAENNAAGKTTAAKACTPDSLCTGCASCFDSCLCGGGAAKKCAETCTPAVSSEPAADALPPTSTDAGKPAKGELPWTFVADGFDIPPGGESFQCQNFANPYGRDVAVLSSESFMTVGSHHMFLFLMPDLKDGALEACSGLSFGTYLHLSQRSEQTIGYPKGVGRMVPANNGMQIMVHYLNTSTDTVHAVVAVTVQATLPENVAIHASQVFANTISVNIPAKSKATVHHSCGIPKDVNLFSAASHMHSHGVHYVARSSDGQLLYETTDWAEPNPWTFSPPRQLKAGSTIDVTCDYDNATDQALTFGESAATNEMCIFVGGYYPAADGETITCLF